MIVRYHPDALEEADQATLSYLDGAGSTIAGAFQTELFNGLKQVLDDPFRWRVRNHGVRRVNLRRFPYYIAYLVDDEAVWIVAVAHSARKPFYWKDRLHNGR